MAEDEGLDAFLKKHKIDLGELEDTERDKLQIEKNRAFSILRARENAFPYSFNEIYRANLEIEANAFTEMFDMCYRR